MRLLKDMEDVIVTRGETARIVFPAEVPSGMDPWDYVDFVKEAGGTLPYEEYNSDEDW